MKKIVSLLLATIMMVSFSAVSFAAGTMTVTGSNASVAVNATDDAAKVDVTFTFNFSEEVSLIGFQPEITFNTTNLTLNDFTLTGTDGEGWGTADSNKKTAYGAYISFDDSNFEGTTPAKQYVLTLNFTVNDTATNGTKYDIGIQNVVGTDNGWAGLEDSFALDYASAKSTITVGSAGKTVGFASTVDYVSGKTGVEFAITTNDSAVTTKTKTVKVPFGTVIESKTTGIKMGVNVTGVPSTVSLTATAALY